MRLWLMARLFALDAPVRASTAPERAAQARGAAKSYSYWGAVRYEVRLDRQGHPTHVALERASSDRRSYRLAQSDALELALSEERCPCQAIGRLSESEAAELVAAMEMSDAA